MIIKVPIFVDIDSIDSAFVNPVVEDLSDYFYKILRKQDLNKQIEKLFKTTDDEIYRPKAKIINREKALESLRKGIK
jgi:hypothetical protein